MDEHNTAHFHIHGELDVFIDPEKRGSAFEVTFLRNPAVKDTIESLGVPHPEIGLILVDGAPVGFEHQLEGGEQVSVFPGPLPHLRPAPPVPPRFMMDVHLGRLTRDMRLLGIDTLEAEGIDDPEIAEISAREGRIMLTRDIGLLKRKIVDHGRWVRATDPAEQIKEIIGRYGLQAHFAPLTICMVCNGPLEETLAETVKNEVPAQVLALHETFHRCGSCRKVYWAGTHYERLIERIERLQSGH